ncbi:GNAT family N-acetyltransferase [Pseudomonas sp.]|uniref:GNAT family N-acetyltransferase n=1 Tax=Pseudomonas sp. TaxID=306 RepID=UPI002636AC63|nr:GNAT family N-acetyltransferase [Pseudomonas sp.]
MDIRLTQKRDWKLLKQARLAALLDTPTAFGVSYGSALDNTDEQWQERADSSTGTQFWLALEGGNPLGMVGAVINNVGRCNLIGMWVHPALRGSGVADQLVMGVKAFALRDGHSQVYLDVSPDNIGASRFYLKQGFVFIDEWEPLASYPHINVQTMVWTAP